MQQTDVEETSINLAKILSFHSQKPLSITEVPLFPRPARLSTKCHIYTPHLYAVRYLDVVLSSIEERIWSADSIRSVTGGMVRTDAIRSTVPD
jgi:hypothetical protein